MNTIVSAHPWSEDSLFNKAKLYVEEMESKPSGWQSGFWSALSLEILARAALSHISPVLLASDRNWRNLMHALGRSSTKKGFSRFHFDTDDQSCLLVCANWYENSRMRTITSA